MKFLNRILSPIVAVCMIGGIASGAMIQSSADAIEEPPYTVWLSTSIDGQAQWEEGDWEGSQSATISNSGKYTVTAQVPEGIDTNTIDLLTIETNANVYSFVPEGKDYKTDGTLSISVDSIYIVHADGTIDSITYNGPGENAFCTGEDGCSARLNILNTGAGESQYTTDISNILENNISSGDILCVDFTFEGLIYGGGNTLPLYQYTGDADLDGSVTIQDAYAVLKYYSEHAAGNDSYTFQSDSDQEADILSCVDIDGNNVISTRDASLILQYYSYQAAGIDVSWSEVLGYTLVLA